MPSLPSPMLRRCLTTRRAQLKRPRVVQAGALGILQDLRHRNLLRTYVTGEPGGHASALGAVRRKKAAADADGVLKWNAWSAAAKQALKKQSDASHADRKAALLAVKRYMRSRPAKAAQRHAKLLRVTAAIDARDPATALAKLVEKGRAWQDNPTTENASPGEPHAGEESAQVLATETIQPRKEQYPGAPDALFDPNTVQSAMNRTFHASEWTVKSQGEFVRRRGAGPRTFTLRLDIRGLVDATTTAVGSTQSEAKKFAWVAMLNHLHHHGVLRQLYPDAKASHEASLSADASDDQIYIRDKIDIRDASHTGVELVKLDKHTLKQEKDAKLDIYNYAATFGAIPEFSTTAVRHATSAVRHGDRRGRRGKTKTATVLQVSISMPEHGIEVTARGRDVRTAEIAAALAFKKKAEEYHLSGGAQKANPDFILLNTDTANEFVEYYTSLHPGMSLKMKSEPWKVTGGELHQAQVLLDNAPVGQPGVAQLKKDAQVVAYLLAALSLAHSEPHAFKQWNEKKSSNGASRRALEPITLPLKPKLVDMMRDTLLSARKAGLPDQRESLDAIDNVCEGHRARRRHLSKHDRDAASAIHKDRLDRFRQDRRLETLHSTKASLPMSQYTDQVVGLVNNDIYSIIIGATGSGKTTQVPQILLEHAIDNGTGGHCDVICTQPRRIAASSVAQRVAAERDEAPGTSVGYQVRGDSRLPKLGGSITYCTTGILLEQLKNNADDIMDNVSHLVIDEVHERDIFVDFLLIILKKAVKARIQEGKKVPHIVLMSATLDKKLFSEYLPNTKDGQLVPCSALSVPGRTFPVAERYIEEVVAEISGTHKAEFESLLLAEKGVSKEYLDGELNFAHAVDAPAPVIDWKRKFAGESDTEIQAAAAQKLESLVPVHLLTAVLAHICNQSSEGAILAFLPGLQEITSAQDVLLQRHIFGVDFSDPAKFNILSLHSTVPPDQQRLIFEPSPAGCRKIILATNIAETSVTVPDVKFVIDSGKLREKRYDQFKRISALETVWESDSNARQRAGRAGRVSDGNYYALYSQARRKAMSASGQPELLRSDLQETCLSIKAQGFKDSVSDFLADAIVPPSIEAVSVAVRNLKSIEAFTDDEQLTSLGRILSRLPIHPTLGNMVLLGIIFRCLDPIIISSCQASERPLFVDPPAARTQARKQRAQYFQDCSDHLAFINAFKDLRESMNERGVHSTWSYAQSRFLHFGAFKAMEQTTQQIEQALVKSRLITRTNRNDKYQLGGDALNVNSNNTALVKGLILAGTYPNLAIRRAYARAPMHKTADEDKVMIHPSSPNANLALSRTPVKYDQIYAFNTLARNVAGDSLYMRDTTLVTPLIALLFGGRLEANSSQILTMDNWLPFSIHGLNNEFATRLLLEFRKAKERTLFGAYKDLSDPKKGLLEEKAREIFANGLAKMLKVAENDSADWNGMQREKNSLFQEWEGRSGTITLRFGSEDKEGRKVGRFEGSSDDVRNVAASN